MTKVTVGAECGAVHVRDEAGKLVDQARQVLRAELTRSTWPSSTRASPTARALLCRAGGQLIPKKTLSFWTQGESEDTRCWLPCYDYPNERATSEMIITVPKPLFVLSNGVLARDRHDAERDDDVPLEDETCPT